MRRHRHTTRFSIPYAYLEGIFRHQHNKQPPGCGAQPEGCMSWLGNRDSNPNYLIQNQAFYR